MSFSLPTTKSLDEEVNISTSTTSTTPSPGREDGDPQPEIPQSDDSVQYIFVPLAVFITVIFLSAMVIFNGVFVDCVGPIFIIKCATKD